MAVIGSNVAERYPAEAAQPDAQVVSVDRVPGLRRVRLHDPRRLGEPARGYEDRGAFATDVTMNVYAHVTLDNRRAPLDRLNPQLWSDDDDG